MSNTSTIAKTANSRVYLIEGRARPDHKPSYESCLRMMGVTLGLGDITRHECPDPYEYGKFIEVAQTRGATERPTTSLEGRYAMDIKSELLKMARNACPVDVQLHFGQCTDPSVFNTFKKIAVLESAYLTSYSTEDMGALASGDDTIINETVEISAAEYYEILWVSYGVKAATIITNEVLDVVVCDVSSCGDCEDQSDGCNKIYAITTSAGGSPGTSADIVFSVDGGTTWYAHDIDSLGAAEAPNAIDCLGDYLVVVSAASDSLHYALKSEHDGVTDPDWTEVTTGFVAAGSPRDIFSIGAKAFIVGEAGYVYTTEDATAGVTAVDAGSATAAQLNRVHAYNSDFAVAVGNDGQIIYTENGTNWSLSTTTPVGHGVHLTAVWVKSKLEWWIGSAAGNVYYTLDAGKTWTLKAFPGSGTGAVMDIAFSTDSVGWIAHQTAATKGRILRTYDGGYSWVVTPEKTGSSIPLADKFNRLAYCIYDANFVVGVGLADDAADGVIIIGEAG